MTTRTWDDLASSARWRGVVCFIRNWMGPFDARQGMASDELDAILHAKRLNLPAAVREWYLLAANWKQGGSNVWIRPEELRSIRQPSWRSITVNMDRCTAKRDHRRGAHWFSGCG